MYTTLIIEPQRKIRNGPGAHVRRDPVWVNKSCNLSVELHSLPAALILYDPMQSKRVNTNTSARSVHDPPLNYTATLEDMCPFEGFKHGLCLWFLDLPLKTAVLRWVLSLTRSVSAAHQECREEECDGGGDVRLCVVLWSSRRSTITAKVKSEAPANFFFIFFVSAAALFRCKEITATHKRK